MKKQLLFSAGIATILFTSCNVNRYDPWVAPETAMEIPYSSLTPTTSYLNTFKGANGATTVDFSGQTTRVAMLKELDAYVKTGISAQLDAAKMKSMFENKNSSFKDAALNAATDKTLISKTAQSFSTVNGDAERQRFMGYFETVATLSASRGNTAVQGTAGLLDKKYLVNEKGFEYAQFIQKGMMGAMMLDQISNIYLGTEKQNADNITLVSGKNYTQLEHHWDEAYGYLTSNEYYPKADPADATKWLESFLGSYVRQVSAKEGGSNPADVYMSFLKGRAAIVNNDAATRTAEIAKIRTSLEKAIAIIAVSYLNKTKTATSDAAKFHSLSEGVGFIYSLRYANNAKINAQSSDAIMNGLMSKPNGFWGLTNTDIDAARDQIATAFGLDKNVVVNH